MRTQLRPLLLVTAALATQSFLSATPQNQPPPPPIDGVAPAFVRNIGQADPLARYLSVGGGRPIFFTANDVRIVDPQRQRSLWLTFVDGASRDIDGEWTTGGHVTVLRHASAAAEAPIFRDVVYRNVWRGIDARVSAGASGLKYSFELAPGADPRAIHLRYSGADHIELTDAGELTLNAGGATIVDTRPVAYQELNGRRVAVPVRFVQFESDVAFAVGKYDRAKPLVIDPTLVYATYLGSGGDDYGAAVAVDASGAAYVAGSSAYSGLPTTPGVVQPSWHGDPNTVKPDAFVAKINAAGDHFDYVTYLGGYDEDQALGIAVDAGGNAYVTGTTRSADFPTTAGAYQPSRIYGIDGFLAKLNSTGSALVYSTYLGGNSTTYPASVAVDGSGNAYVVGGTSSTDFPVSPSAQPMAPGSAIRGDGFLLKFNATGSQVLYGTYIGGDGNDSALNVAIDGTGRAVVAGTTTSASGIGHGAGYQQYASGGVFKSTDGGQTFVSANRPVGTTDSIAFAIDPVNPSVVYQGTRDKALIKTTDGGAHWTQPPSTVGLGREVPAIAVNPVNTGTVLAVFDSALWRTEDGFATVSRVSDNSKDIGDVAWSVSLPSVAYATAYDRPSGVYGVWKSTDGGNTWTFTRAADSASEYVLAVSPSNASTVFVGRGSDSYARSSIIRTTDGGTTWTTVYLSSTFTYDAVTSLAIDPTMTSSVWAGLSSGRLLHSTDNGATWATASGITAGQVSQLIFDGGTLYVADGYTDSSNSTAPLHKTTDGGATWTHLLIRGNELPLQSLAASDGTIYAGSTLPADAFVWKVDTTSATASIVWGTYLGGALAEFQTSLAIDGSGHPLVALTTYSADFPITAGGARTPTALVKLSGDGTSILWSEYLATADGNGVGAPIVAADRSDTIYVAGAIGSGPPSYATNTWIGRFDPAGAPGASYSFGGQQSNVSYPRTTPAGITAGPAAGDVFVVGSTNTVNFPVTEHAPQPGYASGVSDAFIAKVSFGASSPPPGPNLALNKPVTASSEFASQYAAGFAVDGSVTTRWSSQFSDPQWIKVDLQATYDISEVILRWETAYGADYTVQVSIDDVHWTTVKTVTGGDGGVDDLTGLSGGTTGRYVKINGTRRGTEWGYSLWELEVYGTPTTTSVPPPWTSRDVGAVGIAGSATYNNSTGVFTVAGSGADIWGTADAFQYVYQPLAGDGSLWVRVLSVDNTSPYAKAGIMFRDGTGANAANVILDVKPDGCAEFMKRDSAGATTMFLATGSQCGLPILLRLARTGSTFTAEISTNQVDVLHLGSTTVTMPQTVNVGLVVSSHDNSTLNTVRFDNVTFTPARPDRALNRPVVSSSDYSPAYAAAYAVDGDASTRWSSQFSEPQWIYVDFGQRIAVNEVVLNWETAYARYYQLQVSDDLTNWTTIGQVIDGDGGVDDVTGLSGAGRYLRLVCITRATEWGFSLWSFQAYGDPSP